MHEFLVRLIEAWTTFVHDNDYLQATVALVGLNFAFWRLWRYRQEERHTNYRLEKLLVSLGLSEQEARQKIIEHRDGFNFPAPAKEPKRPKRATNNDVVAILNDIQSDNRRNAFWSFVQNFAFFLAGLFAPPLISAVTG